LSALFWKAVTGVNNLSKRKLRALGFINQIKRRIKVIKLTTLAKENNQGNWISKTTLSFAPKDANLVNIYAGPA